MIIRLAISAFLVLFALLSLILLGAAVYYIALLYGSLYREYPVPFCIASVSFAVLTVVTYLGLTMMDNQ